MNEHMPPPDLSALEELALDMVKGSHETVARLVAEVRLLMGNGVSEQQITTALTSLRERGLVHAFHRREADGSFVRFKRPRLKPGEAIWWRASDAGARVAAGR